MARSQVTGASLLPYRFLRPSKGKGYCANLRLRMVPRYRPASTFGTAANVLDGSANPAQSSSPFSSSPVSVIFAHRRDFSSALEIAMNITVNINGKRCSHDVEPRLLLVHYLREVVGLTGSHVGCETSLCGACTVELNGKAVKSCTMFAVQADGARSVTVGGNKVGNDAPSRELEREAPPTECR